MTIKVDSNIELKQIELSDSINVFETIDNEREYLGKWLPFVAITKELEDIETFIKSSLNLSKDKLEYTFTIRYEDKFGGIISLKEIDKLNKKAEIGYWISEKYQKKGIITKSVEKLYDFAFNQEKLNRIQIKCALGNKKSINIPEKLGFKYEGIERDGELLTGNKFTDLVIYSKLKND